MLLEKNFICNIYTDNAIEFLIETLSKEKDV